MASLKDDLRNPHAFPQPNRGLVEFVETHISWVFLAERDVFKVKKPVDLGFLDFSTMALRKKACEAEVKLNSRLSPAIYRGVVPITRSADGSHSIRGHGEVVDWAVHMVRLPDAERSDQLLADGRLGTREVDLLAQRIGEFHAGARCDAETARFGTVEVIERNVRENFEQTREIIADSIHPSEARELENWQLGFLRDQRNLFESRVKNGKVRDGHGDLRLQQIYLSPKAQITILDCIEFNDRFRYADTCSDMAFLSMDLTAHGRVDLSERLIASYARKTNDYDLYSFIDFYESYRAFVRGKVATFLVRDPGVEDSTRAAARKEARHYFLQSLSACRPFLLKPLVIAVGGTLATGKSTIADWLGAHLGAPVIDADRTRKYLLGAGPTQPMSGPAWRGAYDPAFTKKVYGEVFRRADVVLGSGRPLILDASFRSKELRARARELARIHGVAFRFIECRAPEAVCRERLLARERGPSISDARVELLDEFIAHFESVDELDEAEHIEVDTSHAFDRVAEVLTGSLPVWPERLTA
jgi:aminoglycoside phosphotransferase family enzyme/predicted kinase